MATLEKKISVDGSFKLKIGETEISLSREEAEALYGELYKALGKLPVYIQYPVYYYNQPDRVYTPVHVEPYKVGDFPPYFEVTCKTK
jgi:hypothetical protein